MMKTTDFLKDLKELHHLVILRISDSLMRPAAYSFLLAYVFLLEIALSEVFLYKLVFENQKYSAFEALVAQLYYGWKPEDGPLCCVPDRRD